MNQPSKQNKDDQKNYAMIWAELNQELNVDLVSYNELAEHLGDKLIHKEWIRATMDIDACTDIGDYTRIRVPGVPTIVIRIE